MMNDNLGFDISLKNKLLEIIDGVASGYYNNALDYSDELIVAIALTYFGLSKEEIISTDKTNASLGDRHVSNIDEAYLREFFNSLGKDSNIKEIFSHYSYNTIIAILRNSLFHSMCKVDMNTSSLRIDNDYNGLNLHGNIPFSFFVSYMMSRLSDKKIINNKEFFIFSTYKVTPRHIMGDSNSKFADNLFLNGIIPIKIVPVSNNGFNIEDRNFKNFIKLFEIGFSHKNKNKFNSYVDYYNAFTLELNKRFMEYYPGSYLEFSIQMPLEEADIIDVLESKYYKNTTADSFDLAKSLNERLSEKNNGILKFLPEYFKSILKYKDVKDFYDGLVVAPLPSGEGNDPNHIQTIENAFLVFGRDRCVTLTNLLYILGVNSQLVNGDMLYRDDEEMNALSFIFYNKRDTSLDGAAYRAKLIKQKSELLETLAEQYHNIPKENIDARKRMEDMMDAILKENEANLDYIQRAFAQGESINPHINDMYSYLQEHPIPFIKGDTHVYSNTTEKSEIKRIVRNAFAHPGRIRVVKSVDDKYNVELLDVDDNGNVSGRGYCTLEDLLYYLTLDTRLVKNGSKKAA